MLHRRSCGCDLGLCGQEGAPVAQRPAIILCVRDLDAPRPERGGLGDHRIHTVDVGSMDDGIDSERQAEGDHLASDGPLARMGARSARNAVGVFFLRAWIESWT